MKRPLFGDLLWLLTLLIITTVLVLPQTQQIFTQLTNRYPYGMGFIKFAILATMGELLALRLAHRRWQRPTGMVLKIIAWGLIGMLITFMFIFFAAGITTMFEHGLISIQNETLSSILQAFLISVIMNLTFGIVFMGLHRISDTYIELRVNSKKPTLTALIEIIDWDTFISFVVFKTIPLFWVPAHTVTFLLPPHYRVVVAAYLSIVLGVILVYSNRNSKTQANII